MSSCLYFWSCSRHDLFSSILYAVPYIYIGFGTIVSFHNIWLCSKLIASRIVCSFKSVLLTTPADLRKDSISVTCSLLASLAVTCHTSGPNFKVSIITDSYVIIFSLSSFLYTHYHLITNTHTHTHTHTHIYIYIYIHTYIRTYISTLLM